MNNKISVSQDDCLIAISQGDVLPARALRSLPPWRAVLIARIANRAELKISDGTTLEELIVEAKNVGGEGSLKLRSDKDNSDLQLRTAYTGEAMVEEGYEN